MTIVNIALPSIQNDLGFSDDQRQWLITAYALAFGSLLLLGGRISDLFGRKRAFVTGLLGFAVASAIGGAAQSFGVLVGARALQGVFGALLAPAALSLLATIFTTPSERGKAFGVFGAIAGAGGAVGPAAGRSADRARLALVPVREPGLRHARGDRRHRRCCTGSRRPTGPSSTCRARPSPPPACWPWCTASRTPRAAAGPTR